MSIKTLKRRSRLLLILLLQKETKIPLVFLGAVCALFFVAFSFIPNFLAVEYIFNYVTVGKNIVEQIDMSERDSQAQVQVIGRLNATANAFINGPHQKSENVPPTDSQIQQIPQIVVTHIQTPTAVKAIYMSSWVAGTPDFRSRLVKLAKETEINSIVIDIKDYTGMIAFRTDDEYINSFGGTENRIPDIKSFIKELHDANIYVIGRISVFQDPHLVSARPDLAVLKESDNKIWTDYKGISWLDAGARDVWDYVSAIGKMSYEVGFDELNFDYIRFPSDGNMRDIKYPFSENEIKHEVLNDFFTFLHEQFKDSNAVISADLFGMTTTNTDDLNIGQILEDALIHFDFVAPMVYPSHYPPNFNGYAKPAHEPYNVVKFSMDSAVRRANALRESASTTPHSIEANVTALKLRPWLQDFDLGADYDIAKVRAQIQATYDAGLTSWMLWNASNRYTKDALLPS